MVQHHCNQLLYMFLNNNILLCLFGNISSFLSGFKYCFFIKVKYENGKYLQSKNDSSYYEINEIDYNKIVEDPNTYIENSNNNIPKYNIDYDILIGTWYKYPTQNDKGITFYINIDTQYDDYEKIYRLDKK